MIGVIKGTMRQKKEANGLPLPIASYKTQLKAPIRSLKVAITAKQSGSGTPAPDNIRPINGVSECNVVRCGVNVWDEETLNGYYSGSNGVFVPTSGQLCSKNFIKVLPNTTYYYKHISTTAECIFYDKNGNFLSKVTDRGNKTFTTPANCYNMHIDLGSTYGSTYNHDISINYPSTDTDYHAYNGNTYTIQLGDTYYGGSLDVTNGLLTVDRGIVDMGSLNWVYDSTYNRFNTTYSQIKASPAARTAKIMCSVLNPITDGRPVSQVPDNSIYQGTSYSISAHDHRFTDATLFTNDVTGQKIVYPLKTPITVQLTPTQVEQLLGANNVFADTGDVEELIYTDRQVYYGR